MIQILRFTQNDRKNEMKEHLKKLRPRKRHLRYVWKGLILLVGLSMIIGQIAFYAISGSR